MEGKESKLVVVHVPGHRAGHEFAVQPVAEQLREFIDEVAQVGAALERHARHALAEQVAHRPHHEVAQRVVAHRHLGHDAHAQAEAHVGLDHVRIDGLQHDARLQLARGEGLVDLAAPRERGVVGDEGFVGDVVHADALLLRQRMARGHHQHVLPFVAGQGDEVRVVGERLGRHADLRHLVDHHACHLVRRGLVQAHVHLGIGLAQLRDRHRQHVARLRVGGGDAQRAAVLRAELLADALEVAHLAHDQLDALEHVLPRLGNALEPLAVAREDVHAQLVFQFDDGLGHPGLRGVERLGGFRQVEVAAGGFLDEAELVQVHI